MCACAHGRGRVTGPAMGFAIRFRKPTTVPPPSARVGQAGRPGGTAVLPPSATEPQSESSLAVAQSLWSRGNLSPLDGLFGATAIVKLVPTSGFGFIGNHLGQRLHKYANDLGVGVDAAEADPTLTGRYAKNKSSIRSVEWNPDVPIFKAGQHEAFIVLLGSALRGSLAAVYGQGAAGLRRGGKLFAGDLMVSDENVGAPCPPWVGPFGGSPLYPFKAHASAVEFAGFAIEGKNDLTENFMAAVRSGLLQSLNMLEELRSFDNPNRIRRIEAFAAQLEAWKRVYDLAAARKIEVACILATRTR